MQDLQQNKSSLPTCEASEIQVHQEWFPIPGAPEKVCHHSSHMWQIRGRASELPHYLLTLKRASKNGRVDKM